MERSGTESSGRVFHSSVTIRLRYGVVNSVLERVPEKSESLSVKASCHFSSQNGIFALLPGFKLDKKFKIGLTEHFSDHSVF